MDPDSSSTIVLLLLVLAHAFFAAAETAIASVRRSRLKSMVDEGHRAAILVTRLTEDSSKLLASSQLGLKLAGFMAAAVTANTYSRSLVAYLDGLGLAWLAPFNQFLAVVPTTLALVLLMLVFGQLTPKHFASRHADSLALWVAYPLRAWQIVAAPFVWLVVKLSQVLTGQTGDEMARLGLPFITEEEIKTIVDAGEEGGVIEEEEKEMIYSIFEFGDTLAREVMVPRVDMVSVGVDSSMMEALDIILDAGHSRLPVYDGNIDNIVGLLYAKDLLLKLRNGENDVPLREMLREVYYVPETKPVDDLLQELQKRKVHIAIVVDEYGGTAGLVTIEDILEEIVGEIQDEYDAEETIMERISENEIIFNARIDLDDLNRIMDLDLPTEDNDTLGGLIYSQLGHVPQVGDRVEFESARITVMSVEGRRIERVKVVRLSTTDPDRSDGLKTTHGSLNLSSIRSLSSDAQ